MLLPRRRGAATRRCRRLWISEEHHSFAVADRPGRGRRCCRGTEDWYAVAAATPSRGSPTLAWIIQEQRAGAALDRPWFVRVWRGCRTNRPISAAVQSRLIQGIEIAIQVIKSATEITLTQSHEHAEWTPYSIGRFIQQSFIQGRQWRAEKLKTRHLRWRTYKGKHSYG